MLKEFKQLAISDADDLVFGYSVQPVKCGFDLVIGAGTVYPEINFTLPPMSIDENSWPDVIRQYTDVVEALVQRAQKLSIPGMVIEFEHLPAMSENPQWGAEITKLLKDQLRQLYESTGIPNALRVTIVDLRDAERPPSLREGKYWELTREAFVCAAQAGADILSIESVGGKEVHDLALLYADLTGIVAALGALATRDMAFLWAEISKIAAEYKIIAGGDTACGFSNTAMQLAGKGMIPTILAALDRAASAPRSLVAYEYGAVGPSKDCAYEGPIIKAITGFPISMEGKSSSCAHFSPLGNIAGAMADLWSNESVQNIRLLSGSAPEAYLELLAYDCRLFNTAIQSGDALTLRNWLIQSDVGQSIEAIMLEPGAVLRIADSIINADTGYTRTLHATRTGFQLIKEQLDHGSIKLPDNELNWLSRLESQIDTLPKQESAALQYIQETYPDLFLLQAYGL